MNQGYIKLYRCIKDNELWSDKPYSRAQAWIDLILKANHEDGGIWVRGIYLEIKRGQLAVAQHTLAKDWGWSKNKVLRFLSYLKVKLQIELQTAHQNSRLQNRISIVNYYLYQSTNGKTELQTELQKDYKRDTNNKNKNNKKNNNKEEINNKYMSVFDSFWNRYPKKLGKKSCKDRFLVEIKSEKDCKAFESALETYLETDRVKNGYPLDPIRFIKRWKDWIDYKELKVDKEEFVTSKTKLDWRRLIDE